MTSPMHKILDDTGLLDIKFIAQTLDITPQKLKRILKEEGVLESVSSGSRTSLVAKAEYVKRGLFKNQTRIFCNPQYPGLKQTYLVAVPTAGAVDFIRCIVHDTATQQPSEQNP